MKRALILVVAISMILTGCFMPEDKVVAEISAGNHYLKGQVIAVEGCYKGITPDSNSCLGVVQYDNNKRAGKLVGDIVVGSTVYKECNTTANTTTCSEAWTTSVGEEYMRGGQI